MGQQQLLLIVLGVIVVGIAVLVAIFVFQANAVDAKRNNVLNECMTLASMAQQYYMRPKSMLGGGKSFEGWLIPNSLKVTANGHFDANVFTDHVEIIGTGNEVVTGSDSVKVQTDVFFDHINTTVLK
jgi:hypothetical protein